MRRIGVGLHRWTGLAIAGFLIVSGLTGAVIAWDHELDDLLNPHLMTARVDGPTKPPLDLIGLTQTRHPKAEITYAQLAPEPGASMLISIRPKVNAATGERPSLGYNQIFLDPITGEELGRRQWGRLWPIDRENLISFLYILHFSLHLPARWGVWLMGIIAILWTLDCIVGFYLTLPRRRTLKTTLSGGEKGWFKRWKPAWTIKPGGSAYRLNFDLHRALGLWLWLALFILAFTGAALNLKREVFIPAVSSAMDVTPTPFDTRLAAGLTNAPATKVGFSEILMEARAEADRRGWTEPQGDVFHFSEFGLYAVRFYAPGQSHGNAGAGPRGFYMDAGDGRVLAVKEPWQGTAGDTVIEAQLPLHSGRIAGLPGRILVSVTGIVVAALSVTGIVIWARKRRARKVRRNGEAFHDDTESRIAAE